MDGEHNFEDALNGCKDMEDKSTNVNDYNENVANLLTIAKLRNFIGHGENKAFQHRIRLNAIKFNGLWWAVHRFHDFEMEDIKSYCYNFSTKAIQLSKQDFALFPNWDFQDEGHDLSTLAYNPHKDDLELVSHKSKLRTICTHKKENKIGKKSTHFVSKGPT